MITDELLCTAAQAALERHVAQVTRDYDPTQPHCFSLTFERKIQKLRRRANHLALYRAAQQAACFLVVAALSFSGLMVTSQAFRTQVISDVMDVFPEMTEFLFQYDPDHRQRRTPGDFVLNYLPEGMEEVERTESGARYYILYENSHGDFLEIRHIVHSKENSYAYGLDTENAQIEYFTINGSEAIAVSKGLDRTILWSSGNSTFILNTTLSMPELKEVAMNLK